MRSARARFLRLTARPGRCDRLARRLALLASPLLAAPLLAVVFAYRALEKKRQPEAARQTPPGQVITGGRLISPEEPMAETPQRNP